MSFLYRSANSFATQFGQYLSTSGYDVPQMLSGLFGETLSESLKAGEEVDFIQDSKVISAVLLTVGVKMLHQAATETTLSIKTAAYKAYNDFLTTILTYAATDKRNPIKAERPEPAITFPPFRATKMNFSFTTDSEKKLSMVYSITNVLVKQLKNSQYKITLSAKGKKYNGKYQSTFSIDIQTNQLYSFQEACAELKDEALEYYRGRKSEAETPHPGKTRVTKHPKRKPRNKSHTHVPAYPIPQTPAIMPSVKNNVTTAPSDFQPTPEEKFDLDTAKKAACQKTEAFLKRAAKHEMYNQCFYKGCEDNKPSQINELLSQLLSTTNQTDFNKIKASIKYQIQCTKAVLKEAKKEIKTTNGPDASSMTSETLTRSTESSSPTSSTRSLSPAAAPTPAAGAGTGSSEGPTADSGNESDEDSAAFLREFMKRRRQRRGLEEPFNGF